MKVSSNYVLDFVKDYIDPKVRRSSSDQIVVRCPFHNSGQEKNPSLSINTNKGLFNCFTCGKKGNMITLRKLLNAPAGLEEYGVEPHRVLPPLNTLRTVTTDRNPFRAHTVLSETFIHRFNWCPDKLVKAGFSVEWLEHLQIGVDTVNSRITYPIRDVYGNLAGFSGGSLLPDQLPKYKVYKKDDYGYPFKEDYKNYEFNNHNHLWNYHQVYPRLLYGDTLKPLIVVEGFKACIWMLQHGYPNTVALMGSSLSDTQLQLMLRVKQDIILFLDNDMPGIETTYRIGNMLLNHKPTIWSATYKEQHTNCSPDDLSYTDIKSSIQNSVRIQKEISDELFKQF